MVEDIEKLRPELEGNTFGNLRGFRDGHVKVGASGTTNNTSA